VRAAGSIRPAASESNVTAAITAELADRSTQAELEMEAGCNAIECHTAQPSIQPKRKGSPARRQTLLFRDYETKGTLNLSEVGAWKYASHPTTDVWCCAYAVDEGPIKLWVPGDPVPAEFAEAAQNPDWRVLAFNDQFERLIEQHIMAPRYGWRIVPIERHRCIQTAALALALPATLDNVARALKLEQQKDESGRRTMLQMAMPRRPRQDEDPAGLYWFDDPERRAELYNYNQQDVAVERALHHRIGSLSPDEQSLWVLDAVINDRGLFIDGELLDAAIRISEAAQSAINTELQKITEGALRTINQPKMKEWLGMHGCEVADIQKATLQKVLAHSNVPPGCRRVIELRLDGAHAATAKLRTMRDWRNPDGRARGTLRFHGASTGRWTSFGIQTQNMKRPLVGDIGAAIEAVATGDFDHLRRQYRQPMSVVGDISRALICAPPGHRLITADFSGVESRITAWLSGQQSKLDQWDKFDRTQDLEDEPYFILGSKTFGLPREQARAIGKVGDLAFGYMGGEGAYRKLAPLGDASTREQIKRRQQAWRNANSETVGFWGAVNRAAIKAIQRPGTFVPCKRITFEYNGSFLFVHLPSGRKIAYPFPRLKTNNRGDCVVVFMDNDKGKWVECRGGQGAYGGIWIENAVQAIARDLFAAAMPRLENASYRIVLHIHDEICVEVPEDFGSAEEFLQIITTRPSWAEDLPIAAKVREGERFCKITQTKAMLDDAPPIAPEDPVDEGAEETPVDVEEDAGDDLVEAEEDGPDLLAVHGDKEHDGEETRGGNSYASGERPGRDTAEYIYRDANSSPYLRVVRTSAKQFPQYHWENNRWLKGKPAGPKIPYRLPEFLAVGPTTPIFICEGEKDADRVASLGLITTTNSEGAGKWTPDLNKWFAGKKIVYILEDNDDAGRGHAAKVAVALHGIVPEIRVVSFSELPDHGDVSDWLEMDGTKALLLERAKTATPPPPRNDYTLVRASEIRPRAMDWLWEGHLLRGSLELLTGLPGKGKSQVHCQFVANVTTGRAWPDGTKGTPVGSVIMLTAEDCLDQTIIPRLTAAKANLDRVHILKKIRKDNKERMFLLAEDVEILAKAIADVGDVGLVTIDPITAYMGGKVDSHRTTDVRNQLGPLADLAERTNVAFSAITHPAKNPGQRAIDHFIGSQAFVAVARIGHLCVDEMDENESGQREPTGRVLFANAKNNVHVMMPSLAYHISQGVVGTDQQTGADILTSSVEWDEVVDMTADQALAAVAPTKDKSQQSGAVGFLLDVLANGPVPVKIIEERAAARGFSKDQQKRAKQKMCVVAFKEGLVDGRWIWALPQHAPQAAEPL
jgi:DNA polymerase bacteriophage-type